MNYRESYKDFQYAELNTKEDVEKESGKNMKCSYCQTDQEPKKVCSFCEADMYQTCPTIKQYLSKDEAYQPQPILATYHTCDLLILLKHLRKKRSFYYYNMQLLRNAPSETHVPTDINQGSQQIYQELTAHKKVIEGILMDRLGYKPKRVDQKLLEALTSKIERSAPDKKESGI